MTMFRKILVLACICYAVIGTASAQFSIRIGSDKEEELPVADIGEYEAGQVYELTLVGQNLDCQKPQDFRFDVSTIDWLHIPGDDVVRDLAPGEQGSIPAEMDFTQMPPGEYEGQLDVICETCKVLIFTNCNVDKNSVILRVHLVEPQFDDTPFFPGPDNDFPDPVPGDYDGDGVQDSNVYRPDAGNNADSEEDKNPPVIFEDTTELPIRATDEEYEYEYEYDSNENTGQSTRQEDTGEPQVDTSRTYDERDLVFVDPAGSEAPEGGIYIPDDGIQDIPVPGDYDGDGTADPNVFRPDIDAQSDREARALAAEAEARAKADADLARTIEAETEARANADEDLADALQEVRGNELAESLPDDDLDNMPGADNDNDNDMPDEDDDFQTGFEGHPGDGMDDGSGIGDGRDDIILPPRSENGTDTAPPQPTPGQVEQLTDAQRRNLENARAEATRTHDALEEACKKRDDCWEELAQLRAARDQAKVAADAAAAMAKTAADAAADAQAHLDAYDADVAAANAAEDHALERVNAQNNALAALRAAGRAGASAIASAEAELTEAVEAKNALAVARQRVVASLAARQAAANNTKAASETAAAASANAAAALATAQAALDAKERECAELVAAKAEAEQAAATAAATAAKAEADAPAQAAANIQAKIDAKKAALQRCLEDLRHRAHVLEQMTKALKDIGVIGGTPTTDRELDFEGDVTELIVTTAVDGVADLLNVATFQVFTILDSLKAAYGIIDILRLDLTPSRSGYDGDDNLDKWLQDTKGYADSPQEAAEIRQAMTEFIDHGGNPVSLKEKWDRQVEKCRELERELAALQAQQAALPK